MLLDSGHSPGLAIEGFPAIGHSSGMANRQEIFICYAGPDRQLAVDLFTALEESGLNAWCDATSMYAHEVWDEVIPAAIRRASLVAVLITRQWPTLGENGESHYNSEEVAIAIRCVRRYQKTIVPIRFDGAGADRSPYGTTRVRGIDARSDQLDIVVGELKRSIESGSTPVSRGPIPVPRQTVSQPPSPARGAGGKRSRTVFRPWLLAVTLLLIGAVVGAVVGARTPTETQSSHRGARDTPAVSPRPSRPISPEEAVIGRWTIDLEATMAADPKMREMPADAKREAMKQAKAFLGSMSFEFTRSGTAIARMGDKEERSSYRIVGVDGNTLDIRMTEGSGAKMRSEQMTFVVDGSRLTMRQGNQTLVLTK